MAPGYSYRLVRLIYIFLEYIKDDETFFYKIENEEFTQVENFNEDYEDEDYYEDEDF